MLVNKAHSAQGRSKGKQGAQKVGCVNHAMVEQLTGSTMESWSQAPLQSLLRLLDGTDPSTANKDFYSSAVHWAE